MNNEVINRKREASRQTETLCKLRGMECYKTFDKSERTVVQFGMFPHGKTLDGEKAVRLEIAAIDPDFLEAYTDDIGRWFVLGIMDAANAGPDKMVV